MLRFILTTVFISLLILPAISQPDNRPRRGPGYYFNQFQTYSDKNVDSALHYARLLAADPSWSGMLQELLHNGFAQTFQRKWEKEVKDSVEKNELKGRVKLGYMILDGMLADTSKSLVETAQPIYFWTSIMQNENNKDEQARLTNEFISSCLSDDLYKNRNGRYGLLIHQLISKNDLFKELSEKLLQAITVRLKNGPININRDTASRSLLVKRAWYRFLYAYLNSLYADIALKKGNEKEAGEYFKTAFDYSPDLKDKNNYSAFFYDMHFILEKEKQGFQDEYLDYLTKYSADKQQTLATLLKMALTNPDYKIQLQSFYNKHFSTNKAFSDYWIKSVNQTAKNAPAVSLKKTDGLLFSSASNKGKWILIDFWGTWCTPCREEHPDLEKFYQSIKTLPGNKITILTVACNDDKENVAAYMSQFKYTFPVAMADDKIEKVFSVNSYPSKILVTPQNKYLLVPFGIDWVDFIKKYADL